MLRYAFLLSVSMLLGFFSCNLYSMHESKQQQITMRGRSISSPERVIFAKATRDKTQHIQDSYEEIDVNHNGALRCPDYTVLACWGALCGVYLTANIYLWLYDPEEWTIHNLNPWNII